MKLARNSLVTVACAGLALLLLSGCEDNEARTKAAEAASALNAVKAEVSQLRSENEKLSQQIKGLRDELDGKIESRTKTIRDEVVTGMTEASEKLNKVAKDTASMALTMIGETRDSFKRELSMEKTSAEEALNKYKQEVLKKHEELKAFMDNQLRELYPYAYQPRRLEQAGPPAENK